MDQDVYVKKRRTACCTAFLIQSVYFMQMKSSVQRRCAVPEHARITDYVCIAKLLHRFDFKKRLPFAAETSYAKQNMHGNMQGVDRKGTGCRAVQKHIVFSGENEKWGKK